MKISRRTFSRTFTLSLLPTPLLFKSMPAFGTGGTLVTATGDGTVARSLEDRFADTYTPLDFGAVGDGVTDDQAAIQAAVNSIIAKVPTNGSDLQRSFKIHLDLAGRVYCISSGIDLTGANGLVISNGAIIADGTIVWPTNSAMLYTTGHILDPNGQPILDPNGQPLIVQTYGLTLENVTINGNLVANCCDFQYTGSMRLHGSHFLGWYKKDFGIQFGPDHTSRDFIISNCRISGWRKHVSDSVPSTWSGTALKLHVNDWKICDSIIDSGANLLDISGGGWQITDCHMYNGYSPDLSLTPSNVPLITIDGGAGGGVMTGNYFDNGCIKITGYPLHINISGNWFLSNLGSGNPPQGNLPQFIILKASATGQTIADFVCADNKALGYLDEFIAIDETNGSYTALRRTVVSNNSIRSNTANYNAYPIRARATSGTIHIPVTTTNFTSDGYITVPLSNALLLPIAFPAITATPQYNLPYSNNPLINPPSNRMQWYQYDISNGKLTLKFESPWNGHLWLTFDQSRIMPENILPENPSNP